MTANTMTQRPAKKPCGCGGSGGVPAASGCGCKGGCGCDACQTQVYERPQFFAGQLLTEDDLQSLVDYVVAKNQLHNRYLFGDGVVCGLTVTCPPCGTGHVTVNPGYALDCCGNDIVVSCPKDLDINQMVHQLMLKLRKADCGDPCAKTTAPPVASAAAVGSAVATSMSPSRRYCLYIDYCEQSTDPVTPYASNNACGQGVCEPTRVQEGFKFELRCPPATEPGPAAGDRFWNCVGDRKAAERTVAASEFLRDYEPGLKAALTAVRENPAPALDEHFWDTRIKEHTQALRISSDRFAKYKVKDVDDAKLRPFLDQVLELSSDVARVRIHPDPRLVEKHHEILAEAEEKLRAACDSIRAELIEHALPNTLARLRAKALLDVTRELVDESARLRGGRELEIAPANQSSHNLEFRLLAFGSVVNRPFLVGMVESFASMRDWLIERLEQQGVTHCTLLCQLMALSLPAQGAVNETNLSAVSSTAEFLRCAVQEVLRSCLCNSLIPPCAPCEDAGVLLACLTVKDCQVVDICNLDRKFVITGSNIRYWLPEIGRMGEVLEEWCCPSCHPESEDKRDRALPAPTTYEEHVGAALGRATGYTKLAISSTLEPPGPLRGPLEFLAPMISSWRTAEDAALRSVLHPGGAAIELQKNLESALNEIKNLKREQTRLRDRMAKIEAKSPEQHP
jgi:hypothetical protein